MNVMPTVAYSNEIVLGGGGSVLVWTSIAHGPRTNLVVIEGNFLRANNIAFMNDWLAKSRYLNPIEHLCDNLDQRVKRCHIPPSNVISLRQALIREWNIPQVEINTFIYSMLQPCQAVLHAVQRWSYPVLIWILVSDPSAF